MDWPRRVHLVEDEGGISGDQNGRVLVVVVAVVVVIVYQRQCLGPTFRHGQLAAFGLVAVAKM